MKSLIINLPNSFEMEDKEFSNFIYAKLYEEGKLSLGQAAELAGLSKKEFAIIIGKYGVSIFNYPASDLTRDVANA